MALVAIVVVFWLWQGLVAISEELAKRIFPMNTTLINRAPFAFTAFLFAIAILLSELLGVDWQWFATSAVLFTSVLGHIKIRQRHEVDRQEELRRDNHARDLYRQYENNPRLINDPSFREEFFKVGAASQAFSLKDSSRTVGWNVYGRATGWKCAGCGKMIYNPRQAHIDHIKPKSKYPHLAYLKSNLQILCARCNSHKGAYDGDDWKEEIKLRKKKKAVQRRRNTLKAREEQNSNR